MKLEAISSRGTKRDFIDFYFICHQFCSIEKIFSFFERKYSGIKYNKLHLIKSMLYFTNAENDEMPKMIEKVS